MASVKLRLGFPAEQTGKPVSYHLVKDYDLAFNIFQAHINPGMHGKMIVEIIGKKENIEAGFKFLRAQDIEVHLLENYIAWDENACMHCGACTGVCPSDALILDDDAKLCFDESKCVACEVCIKTCPVSAMHINYD